MSVGLAGLGVWLVAVSCTSAAEVDLYSGLAYLRAGAQTQAEEHFTKYCDEGGNPEVRRNVARVLPLLRLPLSEEVRNYIAATLEDSVRATQKLQANGGRPGYRSRMFPAFP